jgi:spore germination cell wall hydrolase CwlJ-like protein
MTPFDALPDDQLLGLCIDREAEGEPDAGRIGVGSVVLNRVAWGLKHKGWGKLYGDSIKSVILAPSQFSWTIPNALDHNYLTAVDIARDFRAAFKNPEYGRFLWDCYSIAVKMISKEIEPNTSALYYKKIGIYAPWAVGKTPIMKIGHHEFFA